MPPKKNKEKQFKFNGKLVFLTYPKCPLDKEVLKEFLETLGELTSYTIGREKHQDGSYHLHATCRFADKIHTTDPKKFDAHGYHPNIKSLKAGSSWKNHVEYAKKEGDVLTNENVVLGKRAALFKAMLEEGLTPKFVISNPEIMQYNFSNLRAWLSFAKPVSHTLEDLPKKRHFWISGPANTGKSTFLRAYKRLFEAPSIMPYNDDWTYLAFGCDLIFADEYKGQLTIQKLNSICDGGAHLNTKGGSVVMGQPLVLICSNYSIEECYGNTDPLILVTLHARFNSYVAPSYPRFPVCHL